MRKYITATEWVSFYSAINGNSMASRDRVMFMMAYHHGLRVSELCNLKISDIDLDSKTVFIKRLKNGFSTTHPLQDLTCELIKKWLDERKAFSPVPDNDWLFLSFYGKKISRQWIYKLSRHYSIKAGLAVNVHPHMLRHACGYALANQGLDTRLIQDYLGHKNIFHTVHYTASNSARFNKVWKNTG
ncbi:tyrosine-type recombinase/integrase [Providencia rettgeri]|uniref:tyrosine-type recombinase/integrase n=1 Tax=Providencia rettgeri TaxID=587 RepID=UPI0015EBAA5D|nr:tyrosine-type recombinase/integrase [Providencia rettgeri]QLR06113.1 tyrosine-type recombinase/integrase [Providencia rettgeri]